MTELQKYTFTAACRRAGAVRGLGGAELHGLLFSLLRDFEPALVTEIHEAADKPFALSPLTGPGRREKGSLHCETEKQYRFTLSCLNTEMCALADRLAGYWPGMAVRLGTAEFRGETVTGSCPDGLTYQDILTGPRPPREITIAFRSPTSFRQLGTQIVFPLPERVFGSLRQRWNSFSPVQLHTDTDFGDLLVSRYELRTEMVAFDRYSIVGFTGRCSYRLPLRYPDFHAGQLQTLARYASLAGVGYKVTMGLGQAEMIG
ncbi:CRISPR system precrRNA processing endoribonuclease RAMP protein Cas6 [Desulfotomaculum copahuensis]|uniref:CRISPR-associated protein Cas6 C-terminal domain-containing protein n=1 Tax=Desulfotomaculum copahuensis TaxID=1838280 RepID=A0A1B7LKG4_9FIRM|nr:CRISPR system precrRNA processing endoribonuclease RAMP protein Cas6 [Desulfotomaculum copahuensis]OAT87030.1 hypothetical protein A6M21_01640 [Desulfotomaculum copahuensis]